MSHQQESVRGINEKTGLFVLILLMGAGMVTGSLLSMVAWKISGGGQLEDFQLALANPANVGFIRLAQTILAACIFFIPSIVATWLVSRKPFLFIGFHESIKVSTLLWGCLLMGITIFLSGSLATLNEMIPLNESLKIYAHSLEASYMRQVELMSIMNGTRDLLIALLVMALAPALFEEVFFRGSFQNLMYRATGQMWTSILITSLLFSAIHFSFYGFLSRLALSIVLGLLYAYTQSIWMVVIAHFLNNAMGVFQIYYLRMKGLPIAELNEDKYPIWWGIIALGALIYLFSYFKKSADGIRS
jgi:membrane protease YdiL (CAAX protease family)